MDKQVIKEIGNVNGLNATVYIATRSSSEYINGSIDEVHIWDLQLTDSEILAVYNEESSGTRTTQQAGSMVVDFSFDTSSQIIPHINVGGSGYNNSGTFYGESTLYDYSASEINGAISGALFVDNALSNMGAYSFDGDGVYVVIANDDSLDFSSNDLTVASWITINDDTGFNYIFDKTHIRIRLDFDNSKLTCQAKNSSGSTVGEIKIRYKFKFKSMVSCRMRL